MVPSRFAPENEAKGVSIEFSFLVYQEGPIFVALIAF